MRIRTISALIVNSLTLAVFTTEGVYGQATAMKHDKPFQIGVFSYYNEECPGSQRSLDRQIDAQLVRQRIKRVKPEQVQVALVVSVDCTKRRDLGVYAFSVTVVFRREAYLQTVADRVGQTIVYFTDPISHRVFGISTDTGQGDKYLEDAIDKGVESALVSYMKANFDL